LEIRPGSDLALAAGSLYLPSCLHQEGTDGGNQLVSIYNVPRLGDEFLTRLKENMAAWVVPHLLLPALILVAGLIVARIAKRWLGAAMTRSRMKADLLLVNFFLRVTSFIIISLTVLMALDQAGVAVGTFVAGLGITGILLGFGLRDTLSNLAAGVQLLIYRPFRAGQVIDVDGTQGVVDELTIVNMKMTTTEGVRVIMPNSKVWGTKITNYSASERRRIEFQIKVPKKKGERAIEVLKAALDKDARILKDPAVLIRAASLIDNAAVLVIWAWVSPSDFQSVSADGHLRILSALTQADLETM
jgi:small conductance mechanosensitive channel